MSIVYRTYLHTIMENNKVVFLCLILLLVLVVSNYVKVQEGFETNKLTPEQKGVQKAATQTSIISSNASTVKKGIKNKYLKKMQRLVKNMENKIKKNNKLSKQVLEKAIGLDANAKQISNSASTIDAKLANVTKINNSFETNASNYITKISGLSETVNKSVEANKGIQNEINGKVGGIDKQMETIKKNTDAVIQIKNDVDKSMIEFKDNSETMLKMMQMAINNKDANQIPAKTQGFQNMNDPVINASSALKKDMESAKLLAFTTIESAYNGDLHLETPWTNSAGTNSKEGFVDSTTTKSAYVDPADIFNLEKEVLTAFNIFNTKYYDVYQTCLQSKRKIKDRINNGETGLTEPDCSTPLQEVHEAKTELDRKIATLKSAIGAMGEKPLSEVRPDGKYIIANRKVTEQQFIDRHNQIKTLHNTITTMRSELDMKMANLLDKSKGPLPEAQNKYNYENYATIVWSVLATSILYYTFVEMQ